LHDAISGIDATFLNVNCQAQREEIRLHREMAVQLIDLGYRAMAMRLHPDKGGSRRRIIGELTTTWWRSRRRRVHQASVRRSTDPRLSWKIRDRLLARVIGRHGARF
jgi:hypothetical protein